MANKLIAGQKPFTVIAPIKKGGSDPSKGRNGVISRTSYRSQTFIEVAPRRGINSVTNKPGGTPGMGARQGLATATAAPVRATGTVTLTPGDVDGTTTLQLGPHILTFGVEFDSAATLATAVEALIGFSATEAAGTVTISGPYGPEGNETVFKVSGYSPGAFTLTPNDGSLQGAEPYIGPAEIA